MSVPFKIESFKREIKHTGVLPVEDLSLTKLVGLLKSHVRELQTYEDIPKSGAIWFLYKGKSLMITYY